MKQSVKKERKKPEKERTVAWGEEDWKWTELSEKFDQTPLLLLFLLYYYCFRWPLLSGLPFFSLFDTYESHNLPLHLRSVSLNIAPIFMLFLLSGPAQLFFNFNF